MHSLLFVGFSRRRPFALQDSEFGLASIARQHSAQMHRRRKLLCLVALLFFAATASLWPLSGARAAVSTGLTPGYGAGPAASTRADLPADIAARLALMSELVTAPAPPWLNVGARLTYHVMSAAAAVHVIGSGGTLGRIFPLRTCPQTWAGSPLRP